GEKHLKLKLARAGVTFDAMHFFHTDPLPERIQAVYALMTNEYNGQQLLQLKLQHWERVADATGNPGKKVAG
ncbi:MAG: hypothetical protein KKG40_10190, partial [Gammaproteobacteria bacterium]|nr:hypothetical protein [Gammaproteobacteria bacterium]